MKNYFRKVVKAFKLLPDSKFLTFGQGVTTAMSGSVTQFPNPTPPLAVINTELDTYSGLLQACVSRDKVQVALKNQSKLKLSDMLSELADYVNLSAQGDVVLLTMTGFDLNKVPEPITLGVPTGLSLTDGDNSGQLTMRFKGVPGAMSYIFQYTTDALLGDSSWVSVPATTTSYTFTGLIKGATYYCRVVAVGSYQQVNNSDVVNRISQ